MNKKAFLEKSLGKKRNKKGVSELIAFVLLIGFAVGLGVFVSRWALQQAQQPTAGVKEMIIGDIQCADVAISGICTTTGVTIKNRGTLTIISLLKSGDPAPRAIGGTDGLKPNEEDTNIDAGTYTPVIKVDDKIYYCPSQKQEFICPQ